MDTSDAEIAFIKEAEAYLAVKDRAAAIRCLEAGLAQDPKTFRGWVLFSRLLYEERDYAKSIKAVQMAESFDPLVADFQLIQRHIQRGNLQGADEVARDLLDACPGHPRAIFTLAHIEESRGRHEQRVDWIQQGLNHTPANLVLRKLLVRALESSGAYRHAVETAKHLVELQETFETVWGLASILLRYGQNELALEMCDRAEPLASGDRKKLSEVALVRGQLLRIVGSPDEGIAALKKSLTHNPLNGASWWGLADTKTYEFTPEEEAILRRLQNEPRMDRRQKAMSAFALARQLETKGDTTQAMAIYHEANALGQPEGFDIDLACAAAGRLKNAFTEDALATRATPDHDAPIPIFIVGLPRSGSTLIEQILASHTQIEGTMELPVLPGTKRRAHVSCVDEFKAGYLEAIGQLPEARLTALGQSYLTESSFFRSSETLKFTDKMPFNFEHVGLIHKILPQAVVIDARRNPLDCGLSIYKQSFSHGSAFAHDLETIGKYYSLYLSIMDHWERVLPGQVLRVQYESLVRSPEKTVRRMLEHVGVPFELGCLAFHTTHRAVRTASSEQVRQPIYTRAIGAWRAFDTHLDPLRKGLGDASMARFADVLD
ncbi:MAG: sulfotransferase [Pseudomonadota bacterium]